MPVLNNVITARHGVRGNLANKEFDIYNRRAVAAEASAWRGKSMDARRRIWLVWLAAGLFMPCALIVVAVAQDAPPRIIEVRIENREVVAPREAIRVTQGDVIELVWTSDEATELHLHGYDLEIHVRPNEPTKMVFEAYAAGRFPITVHGRGERGDGHDAAAYLEVHPR